MRALDAPGGKGLEKAQWLTNARRVKPTFCPECGKRLSGVAQITTAQHTKLPQPGDLTVCIACKVILCFTPHMGLRVAILSDFDSVEQIDALREAQQNIARAQQLARSDGQRLRRPADE